MRNAHAFRRLTTVAATALLISTSAAAFEPAATEGPTLSAYRDGVHTEAARREMAVSVLDIAVKVRGDVAETTVTTTFTNPSREILEGQFALNMPRGAVVTGYALDINGELIEGVLETKYKAAEAYQRRVARRIDPGLAEVDYSDRFETRIYPINPGGSRTIRLRMVSAFDAKEGYSLPLALKGKIGRFKLNVEGDARIVSGPNSGENVELRSALKLAAQDRSNAMLVSEHPGAERFFDIVMPAPRSRTSNNAPLHLFWDRSVSRGDDDAKTEAGLAAQLAASRHLRTVKVTFFDSGAAETREIGSERLEEELNKVRYRGGTSYGSLANVTVAKGSDCLMFTDGRVTIDDRRAFSLPCSISTVASGAEMDRAWLSEISERSGGAFLDLGVTKAGAALAQLQKPEAGIVSVSDSAGERIEFVKLPAAAGSLHIVGPMPDTGPVLVRLTGEALPHSFAPALHVPVFAGPGALWARHKLGVVAADLPPDELARMARRYNVATPQASFVVLETPNDYVQSDIAPPPTYPKALQQQYVSLRRQADGAEASERAGRIDAVAAVWAGQKEWWGTKFKGERPRDTAKRASPDRSTASAAPRETRRPELAAPPAQSAGEHDRIVVTGNLIGSEPEDLPSPVEVITTEELRQSAALAVDEFSNSQTFALDGGAAEGSPEKADAKSAGIDLAPWEADRPYLKRLDKAGRDWEAAIDNEDAATRALPLFWFDIAEWHWRAGRKEEARRAAEAALDLPARDNQTLAIAAARLLRYGSHDRAVWLLERLMEREADRPQPARTLALALLERAKVAKTEAATRADTERAIDLLYKAATELFDVQATGVEEVALMEANAAALRLKALGGSAGKIDERLSGALEADIRVVMEWNTPRTDLDLWVTEPDGEKVGYSSPASSWGGKLSGDVTNGYGPEEYLIRIAKKGVYEIRANTFASDRSNPNGPSTLTVRVFRNFGRPNQSEELIDVEMDGEDRDQRLIGKVTIK